MTDSQSMRQLTVDQRKAIKIDGTYFDRQVIIPHPTRFEERDIEDMTEDIFRKINNNIGGFPDGSFTSTKTKYYVNKAERIIIQEVRNAYSSDFSESTVDDVIKRAIDTVFPSKRACAAAPDTINSEAVATHITRILLQSTYDQIIRPAEETHMSVQNPLAIKNHKWDEVHIDKPIDTPIEYHASTTHALIVNSSFLTKPVYMHAPNTAIVSHDAAAEATETVFNRVNEEFNINTTDEFTALTPIDFAQSLNKIVKEELAEACDLDLERHKNTIYEKVNAVFPKPEKYDTYPDKIYSKNVIWHVTRMVVQTVLDFLTTNRPTHMSVSNPFNISTHKWDEIPIN